MLFSKENKSTRPVKQGVFYQLPLSKNSGPFLSKDIMYNNRKSNTLLANTSILAEHKNMVATLDHLTKTTKNNHPQPTHTTHSFSNTHSFSHVPPTPLRNPSNTANRCH